MELPAGFRVSGFHCGLKQNPDVPDISLFVSDRPAVAAGVYTKNVVVAAPVILDRQRTPSGNMRAIIANSGNANACTGRRGMDDAEEMTSLTAAACGVDPGEVLVMSTGIIGESLPMDKVSRGINEAAKSLDRHPNNYVDAARGLMTTDTVHKLGTRLVEIDKRTVRIVGLAKGAGMIGPKMATLLAVVVTDAPLALNDAQKMIGDVCDTTFNCVSVDGHTSTNDSMLMLANGASGGELLVAAELDVFRENLRELCTELARDIAGDGEGASHRITVLVRGCASQSDARKIAGTIANSPLVKTAVAGADPNWGRMLSAAGYAGVEFAAESVNLYMNGTLLYKQGAPVAFSDEEVSRMMGQSFDIEIRLELSEGDAEARFWTSDLTAEYVRINADYHT